MTGLFVQRQLEAPQSPIPLPATAAILDPIHEWWGIYYQGRKIGYAEQKIGRETDGYSLHDNSLLRLNLLNTVQTVKTRLNITATPEWTLKEFDFELRSDNAQFEARGKLIGRELQVAITTGGHVSNRQLVLRQPPHLAATLKPYIATQNLRAGEEYLFPVFDPSTLSSLVTTVVIEGREQIEIGGKLEPAIKIRQRFKGISVISWIDAQGRTLKEESPAGFVLVRESPQAAKSFAQSESLPLDLITQVSIPVSPLIENPAGRESLRLRLSGLDSSRFALDGGRQRLSGDLLEIRRENLNNLRSYTIPLQGPRFAPHLESTPFVQSDHPKIRALTKSVLGGETDALRALSRIREWVFTRLDKAPTVSVPNALEVMESRKGDCNEHTVLFNAMARAAGIPAKTVVGVVYLRGAFYYHAWSEVWVDQWVALDSVLNQFPADATHVRFLEGEIDQQMEILPLMGNLKIEVIAS